MHLMLKRICNQKKKKKKKDEAMDKERMVEDL
jgi:hypothetical protein